MTREEAIEMLRKDKEQRGNCFISDALDIAISALEQQKTGWIPANKTPSEEGKHLVVCKSIGMGCNLMYIANYAKDLSSVDEYDFENEQRGGWYDYDSESGYFEMSDVIAYMPLPTYKGVEE